MPSQEYSGTVACGITTQPCRIFKGTGRLQRGCGMNDIKDFPV
jgi:hypothetical protein